MIYPLHNPASCSMSLIIMASHCSGASGMVRCRRCKVKLMRDRISLKRPVAAVLVCMSCACSICARCYEDLGAMDMLCVYLQASANSHHS